MFILLLSSISSQAKVIVAGVNYASRIAVKKDTLELNGAGIREKWFLDLYTAGLYVKIKTTNDTALVNCDCLQAFKIVIVSKLVTTAKFNEAIDEVFAKSTGGNTQHIDERITRFKKSLGTGLSAGDELFLIYQPGFGLKVFRNRKYKDTIPGMDFKRELMRLWVGNHPVNDELKKEILGIK
jgi:hypothetical protein